MKKLLVALSIVFLLVGVAHGITFICGEPTDGGVTVPGAEGQWFMSDSIYADNAGGNTLTTDAYHDAATADTTDYMYGTGSASFDGDSNCMTSSDADLDAGFPLKSGDTTKTVSVTVWIKPTAAPGNNDGHAVWAKYNSADNKRSLMTELFDDQASASLVLGYNNGDSYERVTHATDLTTDGTTWYHVTWTYDNSDKSYAIRVRDSACNDVGTDLTGTATLDVNKLNVEDAPLDIGDFNASALWPYQGLMNDLRVFQEVLTEDQSNAVCNQKN